MDKTNANLLFEKIQKFDNIIISKHKTPDWDALGSAEGLRNIISDNFKNKNIFVVGATLDGTGLIDDEKLTPEIIKAALLITVDTANIERLDFENFGDAYTDFEYIFSDAIACTQVITLWANEMQLKISKTAMKYGGGGHLLASGGYLDSWDDLDAFLLDVKNYLKGEK
jgi:phosphoesterase RecJ-like protein